MNSKVQGVYTFLIRILTREQGKIFTIFYLRALTERTMVRMVPPVQPHALRHYF